MTYAKNLLIMLAILIGCALSVGLTLDLMSRQGWTQDVQHIHGPARVIDGDTIEIGGETIRLFGIDAPEMKQTCRVDSGEWECGKMAAMYLAALTEDRDVSCLTMGKDRYGRHIGLCYDNPEPPKLDINATMVRVGLAMDYVQYSKGSYSNEQREAISTKAGIWNTCFINPSDWRKLAKLK